MTAVRFVTDLLPGARGDHGREDRADRHGPRRTARPWPPRWSVWAVPVRAENDWFDLTITVTVGGEEVPFSELFIALAEGQSHLILPSGTFFSLDRDELPTSWPS